MKPEEILRYEIESSPITFFACRMVFPQWLTEILGSYFAWKVNRKLRRYNRYKKS